MYEHMRTAFAAKLGTRFSQEDINTILEALDDTARSYDIKESERSLVVWNGGLPQEAKMYLVSMKMKGLSDGTLNNYRLFLDNFFKVIQKPVDSIVSNDIRAYFYFYRQQRTISDRSADKYRQYLLSFFTWCVDNEYIVKNPMKNVEKIKYETKPRENFDHMELEKIRNACHDPRERAIVELLFSTGCRIAELSNLKKSDIDFTNGTVHLFGKGRKHRISFLTAKATLALQDYYATRRDDSESVIVGKYNGRGVKTASIRTTFEAVCARTDVDKLCVPHVMRHTTATLALNAGMPLDQVSKLLGHESISTTQIYAKRDIQEVHSSHQKYIS